MRGTIILLGALAMLAPAIAQAQMPKPDPFVIEENTMMGRSPRLPEDRVVAADTGGELASVRGKAWWQVLIWCTGTYRFHHDQQVKAGDTAGAAATEVTGKQFIGLAIDRLMADRKISADDSVPILIAEANYSFAGAADGGETHRPFAVDEKRCGEVTQRYGEASAGW